jgi:superfamily II DNA or RNA helicase
MTKTPEEVSQIKSAIQDMAYTAWVNSGKKSTIVAATGVGKSRIAVRRCEEIWSDTSALDLPIGREDDIRSILLVTRTEKLRDINWPDEFKKWHAEESLVLVKRICYSSLNKEKGNKYRLVILDEVHRLTQRNAEGFQEDNLLSVFFAENMADEVMGLTATEPDPKRDLIKSQIFEQISPVCFRYTLDQGIKDGIVPNSRIKIIQIPLERVVKNIPAGTKKAPFLATEQSAYEYMNKQVGKAQAAASKDPKKAGWAQSLYGARKRFISNLPSKNRVAKKIIEKVLPGNRVLIFCGSVDQSRELCGENVHNYKDQKSGMLEKFKAEEIDYLGAIDGVNEGENIPNLDHLIIVQMNSNERDAIQRMGRLRYKENHIPTVYILVSQGTKDEDWVRKAMINIDRERITYESYLEYLK